MNWTENKQFIVLYIAGLGSSIHSSIFFSLNNRVPRNPQVNHWLIIICSFIFPMENPGLRTASHDLSELSQVFSVSKLLLTCSKWDIKNKTWDVAKTSRDVMPDRNWNINIMVFVWQCSSHILANSSSKHSKIKVVLELHCLQNQQQFQLYWTPTPKH